MPLPNSLPWMESADAKMIPAHENIEGVAREINEWFASIDVKIYLRNAPGLPAPWLVVHTTDYIPPIRLSILIGECVHNMRSAIRKLKGCLARAGFVPSSHLMGNPLERRATAAKNRSIRRSREY